MNAGRPLVSHHLKIFRSGQRGDIARLGPDVVDDRRLEPRDLLSSSSAMMSNPKFGGVTGDSRRDGSLQGRCPVGSHAIWYT